MSKLNDKALSLIDTGVALTSEKELQKILDLIISKSMEMVNADGASIYLIEKIKVREQKNKNHSLPFLRFLKSANRSKGIEIKNRVLDLDTKSIAGYVALTGQTLRIDDCYNLPKNVTYQFNKRFDEDHGYRSKSMLVLPLMTAQDEILGVLQVINKIDDEKDWLSVKHLDDDMIAAFSEEDERMMKAMASQAAVALNNAKLTEDIRNLFESFVRASVMAIESRDPTTSGHSDRVAIMTVGLAEAVNRTDRGVFKNVSFSDKRIREIRYASLLHDFGKIGVRENILMKEKKLFPHELDAILVKLETVRLKQEAEQWRAMSYDLINKIECNCDLHKARELVADKEKSIEDFRQDILQIRQKIMLANEPKVLATDLDIEKLLFQIDTLSHDLGQKILPEDLRMRLSIPKGTLSTKERTEIESHVTHTFRFLSEIAWTDDLSHVPDIAMSHHEKLDGTGYPRGLTSEAIPIQSKMMAIVDIYDALTAMDRPYKKAVPTERALDILHHEAKTGKLDKDLLKIFIDAEVFKTIAMNTFLGRKAV